MSARRQCAGRCGRSVPRKQFACGRCMDLLPAPVRRDVVSAAGKPHSASKTALWADAAELLGRMVRA